MTSTNGLLSPNLIFTSPFTCFPTVPKPIHGRFLCRRRRRRRRIFPLLQFNSSAQLSIPNHQQSSSSQQKTDDSRIDRAWAHWRKLGEPKLIVAPMFEGSELPFRMLCRKYGAQAAYSPMLNARIFPHNPIYRSKEFSTCEGDRPLFIQFCGNDPDLLLASAQKVEAYCDYVDINLGCPQRIASKGNYGAFLMDDLPRIKAMVEKLATNLTVPVSCKIRIFPDSQATISYAKMLEDSGCSLLAVHGRTRDERNSERANWNAIRSVKESVKIPVLANGNVRHMDDVEKCLKETGADGILSAEGLLENPALFAGYWSGEWALAGEDAFKDGKLDQGHLVIEYLKLCEKYPVSWKVRISHIYKLLREWFEMHPDIREEFNKERHVSLEYVCDMVSRLRERGVQLPLYLKNSRRG